MFTCRWLKHLKLYKSDECVLLHDEELNSNIINACQTLLSKQYRQIFGFEDTALGHYRKFTNQSTAKNGIQILHTGDLQSTVEPSSKGHFGTSHFVPCRDSFRRLKCIAYSIHFWGYWKCPL